MEQYPDKKREKIKQYQKVIITESEFKKACELDSGELTNIRNEFFKRTFVYPFIGIIFAAVLFELLLLFTSQIEETPTIPSHRCPSEDWRTFAI